VTLDEWEEGQKEASYICDSIKECLVRQKSKEKPQTMAIIARVNRVLDEMQGILTVREIAHERLGSKGIWGEPPVCFMVALLENMLNPMSTAGIDQCLYWAGVDTSNVNLDQLTFKTPPKGKRDAMVVEKLAKLLNACHKLAWSKSDEMVSKVVGMTYCWFLWGVDIGRSTKLQKASAQAVLRIATKTLGGSAATKLGEHVDDGVCGNESTADDPSMKRGLRGPLRKRLHSLSLLNRTGKNEANTVKLVSMHGSKGLEYDRVWLMSCDDGTIPGAIDDKPHKERLALLEEERRLMYVGITRARDSLHLSWSMYPLHRLGGTNQKEQSPCRILDALGRGDRPLSSARVSNDLKAGITV
jgi:superfamily I DNA/RNA helicase